MFLLSFYCRFHEFFPQDIYKSRRHNSIQGGTIVSAVVISIYVQMPTHPVEN